ncbi:MAG: helix-turn-helix transcriptional regulator [Erysipelotrichales bacterium]|nr:helix-turn-helix transcriptional regulator [Erysipelotrichales bacterium]
MISYEPLWKTMKKRKISKYQLVKKYGFSNGTIDRLRSNDHVSTYTIERLCSILNCSPNDLFSVEFPEDSVTFPEK